MRAHIEKTSYSLIWVAIVALLLTQIITYREADADRAQILHALRVQPAQVMERLNELDAELERRSKYVDQLKEQGLIHDGPP